MFVVFPDEEYKQKMALLCLTPLLDRSNVSGDNQILTIQEALRRAGKDLTDIAFIVGDNTAVNPFIARKIGKPIIGCKVD